MSRLMSIALRLTSFSGHTLLCYSNANYTTPLIQRVARGTGKRKPTPQKVLRCPPTQQFPSKTWVRSSGHRFSRGRDLSLLLRTCLSTSQNMVFSSCSDPTGMRIVKHPKQRLTKLPSDTVPGNPPHCPLLVACSAIRVVASCLKGPTSPRPAVPLELFHRKTSYSQN